MAHQPIGATWYWDVLAIDDNDANVRPMHTMVSKLRRKLGDDPGNPTYIFTEPRVGFRMPKGERLPSASA